MGTLRAFGIPGVANFQSFFLRQDIVLTGRAQHGTAGFIYNGKSKTVACLTVFQGSFNKAACFIR